MLKIPVIDHFWQTETGWPMHLFPGIEKTPIKFDIHHLVYGYDLKILSEDFGLRLIGEKGVVAVIPPLPRMYDNRLKR